MLVFPLTKYLTLFSYSDKAHCSCCIYLFAQYPNPNMEPIFKAVPEKFTPRHMLPCCPSPSQLPPARLQEREWEVDEESKEVESLKNLGSGSVASPL